MDAVRWSPRITVITRSIPIPSPQPATFLSHEISPDTKSLAAQIKFIRKHAAMAIQRAFKRFKQSKMMLVMKIRRVRRNAAVYIQKVVRGCYVRRHLPLLKTKHKERIIRWVGEAKEVIIIGTFTNPAWKKTLRLSKVRGTGMFFTTALLKMKLDQGTYHFKFRVNGVWLCSPLYPISRDDHGNRNNCLMIMGDKRLFPRAISTRHLNSEAVSNDLAARSKLMASPSPLPIPRCYSGTFNSPLQQTIRQEVLFLDSPVHLLLGGHMIAHPSSQQSALTAEGSADCYFIEAQAQCFGLADGVGEWSTFGLNAGLFPSELMQEGRLNMLSNLERLRAADSSEAIDLMVNSLNDAEASTQSFGSSTAMLGFCKDSALHVIYVGDSSFIVLRKRENTWTTVYRSVEQQHSFNCPFQLARLPKTEDYGGLIMRGQASLVAILRKANSRNQDSALDARTEVIKLHTGDVMVAGTDGLFDNLYDSDIADIVRSSVESDVEICCLADLLAKDLALKAIEKGWDSVCKSPFSKAAQRAGKRFTGGKLDDTTVIVGITVPQD